MKLESNAFVLDFDPYTTLGVNENGHDFGEQVMCLDGRAFRFAQNNGTNASHVGYLQQAASPKTNHHNMTPTAAAIGTNTITVTPGATAVVANEYSGGYAVISDGTGSGQVFKVSKNPAANSATQFSFTTFDPVIIALDTTSRVTLFHNGYNGVQESTTQTLQPAGVGLVAAAASTYFWVQTRGIAGCLVDQTCALGNTYIASSSVAGAVTIGSTTYATFQATVEVGKALVAGVDTKHNPVFLTID